MQQTKCKEINLNSLTLEKNFISQEKILVRNNLWDDFLNSDYLFAIKGKGFFFFSNLAEMALLLENSAVSRPNTEIPLPSSNSGGGRGSLRYSKHIISRRKWRNNFNTWIMKLAIFCLCFYSLLVIKQCFLKCSSF